MQPLHHVLAMGLLGEVEKEIGLCDAVSLLVAIVLIIEVRNFAVGGGRKLLGLF
jgi:hypothetical protein